ncbi:MAG: hypothetical protein J3Q66DRAFT_78264 [Benniella sp.]|nr:MAG: hypothetical protein J3Q66DRAFT_78264 [Benniella sp.]
MSHLLFLVRCVPAVPVAGTETDVALDGGLEAPMFSTPAWLVVPCTNWSCDLGKACCCASFSAACFCVSAIALTGDNNTLMFRKNRVCSFVSSSSTLTLPPFLGFPSGSHHHMNNTL